MGENLGSGFVVADFSGDGDVLEPMVEFEAFEGRAQAIVPIGNDGETNFARAESCEGGEGVGVNLPGVVGGETVVERFDKSLGNFRDAVEGTAHDIEPTGEGVIEFASRPPGGDELAGDLVGIGVNAVAGGGDAGVNV